MKLNLMKIMFGISYYRYLGSIMTIYRISLRIEVLMIFLIN